MSERPPIPSTSSGSASAVREYPAVPLHLAVRSREFDPEETLLVRHTTELEGHSSEILYLSGNDIKSKVMPKVAAVYQNTSKYRPSGGPGAQSAYCVFAGQEPSKAVSIVHPDLDLLSKTMPGGIPVVDHLAVAVDTFPGWASIEPVIKTFQARRMPSIACRQHPDVHEVVLGQ